MQLNFEVPTREEMLAILELGRCEPATFDDHSIKTLDNMYSEITETAARLKYRVPYGWNTPRAVLASHKVRGIISWTDPQDEPNYLCEIGRIYRNGIIRWGHKIHGLSETATVQEIMDCALSSEAYEKIILRGLREEFKLTPEDGVLTKLDAPTVPDVHESSVYHRVVSEVRAMYFHFQVNRRFRKSGIVPEPNNTWIRVQWFKESELARNAQIAIEVTKAGLAPLPIDALQKMRDWKPR